MNAKKCDRCKKYYDPYKGVKYGEQMVNTVSVCRVIDDDLYSKLIGTENKNGLYFKDVKDLCPECAEKFVKWLNGDDCSER